MRRRNGQVGAERVWDGRAERDHSYFVLFLLLFSYSTRGGDEWRFETKLETVGVWG